MSKLDYKKLNETIRYTMWSTFKVTPGALGEDRAAAVEATREFLARYDDADLVIRGFYDVSAMRAEADFMFWVHAEKMEDVQAFYNAFLRETPLGRASTPHWSNAALHRPAEFNKSHLPSFIMGEEPQRWIAVYPFVRSYDWYLLKPEDRRRILAEHGQAGRDYPDVRANTVPSFALGDYEWILAFEGPELDRIVDLMWKMRYTEARLHVREEIPFHTGRRVDDVAEIIEMLP
ncbi:hydrogen peroxide-dependent heme synthase [uncultured Corynebacterium sp.]|uniref:hydrogen peroxide-dependent heme synthase n=1 Tax=uncultured Corynebacterium sp. TaxID=159447 RepID=UPI0026143A5B|nr:hydrogen peroxide-dependent heme synthase [uncultured Corynebacterium sp.]